MGERENILGWDGEVNKAKGMAGRRFLMWQWLQAYAVRRRSLRIHSCSY
jgi:hypothetical protein